VPALPRRFPDLLGAHTPSPQIYHLACPASPKAYQRNAVKTLKTSFIGTQNMLGLAKRTKARFLLSSTSEVYGSPTVHPQPESYWGNVNPNGPRACYDEGKRVAEALTYGYARQDGVDVRVARIFNCFGEETRSLALFVVSGECESRVAAADAWCARVARRSEDEHRRREAREQLCGRGAQG